MTELESNQGKKILVVDDDPDVVLYLSSVLEDHGYEVEAAGDSGAALWVLEHFCPDVIIIDVLMPGRSGMDLLVTLRTDARTRHIPLVVVTGCDEVLEDSCQSYLGSHEGVRGPDVILGKPIEIAALLDVMNSLIPPHCPEIRKSACL